MKIAHVADPHWGLNYPGPTPAARFEDICQTMDWVADRIIAEGCELVLFAGDAFKDARIFIDRATLEISAFVRWLRKLSYEGIHIAIISGTPSHDAVSAYELIQEMKIPNVIIRTKPDVVQMCGLDVGFLPGMDRRSVATEEALRGLPPHEIHQIMTDRITDMCRDFSRRGASILMSHLSYDLSDTGFEDALMAQEPVLTSEAASIFDLVALGHIHRPQQAGNVYYSGAPERHNFGDEHTTPGFWVHYVGSKPIGAEFIATPARRFVTLSWSGLEVEAWLAGQIALPDVAGAVVRIHYSCSDALQKRFDRGRLEQELYAAGAFYVHEIKANVERTERTRDSEVTESLGPLQAVGKWAAQQGIEDTETHLLQSMTAALLEEVLK